MRKIIGAAAATLALTVCLVPQVALGFDKPPVIAHPDVAPSEPTVATRPGGEGRGEHGVRSSASLIGESSGTNSLSFASLTTGDAIVVLDAVSLTGHAGLFDRSRYSSVLSYAVLSANVAPVSGVQVEKCVKYRMYDRAYGLRVPQEYSHRYLVRDFAERQLGKPYSVLGSKTDIRSFYCSKLVWASYRFVTGVDLDADGGTWVWPVDLLNSRYTSVVGYWS